ncbi:hypothetical protein [Pseudogulbenkiania sp. MAI-1]|nr:hypothetical protein [Pseudogulbenkiania sp. MAI-1]
MGGSLLSRADGALYLVKNGGRNRVSGAPSATSGHDPHTEEAPLPSD